MIPLHRPPAGEILDSQTRSYLAKKQALADQFPPRSPAIGKAWATFLQTQAKLKVAEALNRFTFVKCAYCEQVAAQDIEHFYPKSRFPTRMFQWTNFLRGCKNCNNAKKDIFPLDDSGQPLLVDPAKEDPIQFFRWDFQTGKMILNPAADLRQRAEITRDLFDLDQEPLRERRRQKCLNVLYLLSKVVDEDPVEEETKERLCDHLRPSEPWLGIIRHLFINPGDYRPLLVKALEKLPEMRTWIEPWL